MSNTTSKDNQEIFTQLLQEIVAAADSGSALVLGPQAVKNLRALMSDVRSRVSPKALKIIDDIQTIAGACDGNYQWAVNRIGAMASDALLEHATAAPGQHFKNIPSKQYYERELAELREYLRDRLGNDYARLVEDIERNAPTVSPDVREQLKPQ